MTDSSKLIPLARPVFDTEEIASVAECLASGWVTQGPMTAKFEQLMAERHRVNYALATTSCTAALHLSALALQWAQGDEVIVPAFTWVTSAHCVEYVGAKVVFADIELDTFNIDPTALEAAISPRTRAVVVVHLFGLAARMEEILAIARRHNLQIVEDAACAIGATYQAKPVGTFGNLGCFSFHPRKVITTGEGGMVTTNDAELAERVSCLRNHGASGVHPGPDASPQKPYTMGRFDHLGFNLRLSDIQAAVGIAQMRKLDNLLRERALIAQRYTELLEGVDDLSLPPRPAKCGHTYQSYVVRLVKGKRERRNQIMEALTDAGISTRPGTHAVHRLGYYAQKYRLRPEQFPNACLAEDMTITLPLFSGMTEEDLTFVTNKVKSALVE